MAYICTSLPPAKPLHYMASPCTLLSLSLSCSGLTFAVSSMCHDHTHSRPTVCIQRAITAPELCTRRAVYTYIRPSPAASLSLPLSLVMPLPSFAAAAVAAPHRPSVPGCQAQLGSWDGFSAGREKKASSSDRGLYIGHFEFSPSARPLSSTLSTPKILSDRESSSTRVLLKSGCIKICFKAHFPGLAFPI